MVSHGGKCHFGPLFSKMPQITGGFFTGSYDSDSHCPYKWLGELITPVGLVAIAQVVLGTAIGCRFTGTKPAEVLRILKISIGSTFILMSTAVAGGLLIGELTGIPWYLVTLAYAPGGLAEMSLIAIGIGQDVPFVATHHLCRIGIIILFAPLAF